MFSQENQFYPTPKSLLEIALKPWEFKYTQRVGRNGEHSYEETVYKLGDKRILEPSAGKGDILDFIKADKAAKRSKVKCIEIDLELQEILKGKGYSVISDDFLSYDEDYYFDMVIMNPPFNMGVEHVLKAWDVLKLGGDIVAIINANTILDPCTAKREQLCKMIEDYGSYEIVEDAFKGEDVQRTAKVDVAIVWLEKPKEENPFEFDFEGERDLDIDLTINAESANNAVALNDKTGAMIEAYNNAKSCYVEYMRARQKLKFFADPIMGTESILKIADASIVANGNNGDAYNQFIDGFKMAAWKKILSDIGIDRLMTSKVSQNFEKFTEGQGSLALTKENIHSLVMTLVQNGDNILKQAVVDVFDLFTKYYDENRCHEEGWKTNDYWRVNKKIILPNYIRMDYGGNFGASYSRWSEFADIEKAMCYLSGKKYEEIKKLEDYIKEYPIGHTKKMESEFFDFRCYKKGTIHLFFKSDELWAKFNQVACEGKNWVG